MVSTPGLILTALTFLVAPGWAAACSCAQPERRYAVFPESGARVPSNVRLRLFESGADRNDERAPYKKKPPSFVLRIAGTEKVVTTLAVTTFRPGNIGSLELAAAAPLRGGVYDLAEVGGDVLASYVVAAEPDRDPPAWSGLEGPLSVERFCFDSCGGPGPWVVAHLRDRSRESVVYGVWVGSERDAIDFKSAPSFVLASDVTLSFGSYDGCFGPVYLLPRAGRVRIGIAPVDAAGNRGTGVEGVIDVEASPCAR